MLCTAEIADTALQQGQGMHGSFSRGDTMNFMAAIGPDFKAGFIDKAPVSNADVGKTIGQILGLSVPSHGKLMGRVMRRSHAPGAHAPCRQPAPSDRRQAMADCGQSSRPSGSATRGISTPQAFPAAPSDLKVEKPRAARQGYIWA